MKNFIAAVLCSAFLFFPFISEAQILDSENKVEIALSDGTVVTAYGRANTATSGARDKFSNEYYYLPTNLRLAKKDDGTPEFIFVKYTTDEKADVGGTQGALLHFLMTWGLTKKQEVELTSLLAKKLAGLGGKYSEVINPRVLGAATLNSGIEGETFRIVSGTLSNDKFTPNLATSGRAPLLPDGKMAVAAIMEKNGAQLLAATFEKGSSITDVSVTVRFEYELLTPAIDGRVTVYWEKMDSLFQTYSRDYTHKDLDGDGRLPGGNKLNDDVITDTQYDSLKSVLTAKKIVNFELDALKPDHPVAQQVMQTFLDYFMSSISEKSLNTPKPGEQTELRPEDPYEPPENLYKYTFNSTKIANKVQKGTDTFNLNMRIPVMHEYSMTENLASWYDGVKHNDKCVTSVNLNDPFFQHREIHLVLDAEAEGMFGNEVNAITVDIRKKRNDGNDFQDAIMINKKTVESGELASLTYARGDDKNADVYEYRTSWNLKGKVYPERPRWQKGDWKGINLISPVAPRNIEFECDLEELKAMGFPRATLQMRYMKFDEEFETNVPLTVSKGQGLVEKTIYTDRDTRGYAYRLILTHKKHGKMVLPWEEKINDDYVYAIIPPETVNVKSEIFKKAVEIGKTIASPKDGKVNKIDSILDQFKDLFDTITN